MKSLADMHTDGVYFDEEVKKEMAKKREEETCQYSGLPSPKYYEELENLPIGHA
jgi:hypothetical protein